MDQRSIRLSSSEVNTILKTILDKDENAKVFLYGSRVESAAKGGDIDLIVESETLNFADSIDIRISLKDSLGEQKIDLKIIQKEAWQRDPFLQSIRSVELSKVESSFC